MINAEQYKLALWIVTYRWRFDSQIKIKDSQVKPLFKSRRSPGQQQLYIFFHNFLVLVQILPPPDIQNLI